MTRQDIITSTTDFLLNELKIECPSLEPDTELRRDLGITSVDALAIATFTQKTFGCPLVISELKAIVTLQDLYDYIENYQRNN